jgi:hypothetical protein
VLSERGVGEGAYDARQCPARCPRFTRANVLNSAVVWGPMTHAQTVAKRSKTPKSGSFANVCAFSLVWLKGAQTVGTGCRSWTVHNLAGHQP